MDTSTLSDEQIMRSGISITSASVRAVGGLVMLRWGAYYSAMISVAGTLMLRVRSASSNMSQEMHGLMEDFSRCRAS